MTEQSNDPAVIWRAMIGEMEKGFNAFANQAMASPEFSRAVNSAGNVSAGIQKQLGDLMERYLVSMNLPSRAQMAALGERLQAIEGQLNEIASLLRQTHTVADDPDSSHARPPKPARTRQPPSPGGGQG